MALEAVVFDLGETLVDETCIWGPWADWLGVPRLTFFGVLGGVIARGEDHSRVFEYIRPGFDRAAAREAPTSGRRGRALHHQRLLPGCHSLPELR